MTYSHRCSICSVDWPYLPVYSGACPLCSERTWFHSGGHPLTTDEANELRATHEATAEGREEAERQMDAAWLAHEDDWLKQLGIAPLDDVPSLPDGP